MIFGIGILSLTLSSCSNIANWELSMRSKIGALPLTVSTYDSNGQKIDQIKARSVNIHTDKKMSQKMIRARKILALLMLTTVITE